MAGDWSRLVLTDLRDGRRIPLVDRVAFVEALLSATTVETCPCCGQEVVKPAPLISRETALKMLEPPDAITEP